MIARTANRQLASAGYANRGVLLLREVEDCQIRFPRGSRARIDPERPPNPHPAALADWVRSIRGGMLAGAFYVERNLSVAIEAYFLGPVHGPGNEKADLFVEALLEGLSFERRTNAALLIAEKLIPTKVGELRADLTELRTVRNAMAHNPCWFEPRIDDEGIIVELKPQMRRGRGTVHLTKAQINEWNALVARAIRRTEFLANLAIDPQTVDPEAT